MSRMGGHALTSTAAAASLDRSNLQISCVVMRQAERLTWGSEQVARVVSRGCAHTHACMHAQPALRCSGFQRKQDREEPALAGQGPGKSGV